MKYKVTGKVFYFLMLAIAFAMPLYPPIIPILIVLLLICGIAKNTWQFNAKNRQQRWMLFAFTGFWLLHVLGLMHTEAIFNGWLEIERKLTFLLLPLLFYFTPAIEDKQFHRILWAFLLGCIAAIIINLTWSLYNYLILRPWIEHFFGTRLSHLMHMGYLAIYLNFGIAILAFFGLKGVSRKRKPVLIILFLLFSFIILLTTSKNQIPVMLLLYLLIGVMYIRKTGNYWKGSSVLAGSSLLIILMVLFIPFINQRFQLALQAVKEHGQLSQGSTQLRLEAWENMVDIIEENWLIGIGTGDLDKYIPQGKNGVFLSPHNQYLSTFAILGLSGILFLLSILFLPLYYSIKKQHYLLTALCFIMAIAALTESVFQLQTGIIFYTFFTSLLIFSAKPSLYNSIFHRNKINIPLNNRSL